MMINAVQRPEASLPIKTPPNSSANGSKSSPNHSSQHSNLIRESATNVVPFGRDSTSDDACFNERYLVHKLRRLPKLVHTIRQRSERWLNERLVYALAQVDKVFFELANNAYKQQEQNDYFFAMRVLREHRDACVGLFKRELNQCFATCIDEAVAHEPAFEALAVLQGDEFDELLAVEAAIKRSEVQNQKALMALAQRMVVVYEHDKSIAVLPLAPCAIFKSLQVAIKPLPLAPKVRLALLTIFEQNIVSHLAELYSLVNRHLVQCGILPDVHNHLAKTYNNHEKQPSIAQHTTAQHTTAHHATQKNRAVPKDALPAAQPSKHTQNFQVLAQKISALQNFLKTQNNNPMCSEGTLPKNVSRNKIHEEGAQVSTHDTARSPHHYSSRHFSHSVQQLLALVGDLHNKAIGFTGAASRADAHRMQDTQDDNTELFIPSELLHRLGLNGIDASGRHDVNLASLFPQSPERNTLQVVDGLFGAMRTEQSLSRPLKALLARLQIPLARAALVDPGVLNNPNHSARQLINMLARAGLAWRGGESDNIEGLEKDPLYQKMHSIVTRATHEYNDDNQLFSDLVTDFEHFTHRDKKRLAILERRMLDAEKGRIKAEAARRAVANTLGEACRHVQIDGVLNEFIHKAWQQVLYVTYLKYGEGSNEWNAVVQPLTDLMISLEDLSDFIVCEYARKQSDQLLQSFKQGLDNIAFDPFEADRLLRRLAAWYRELRPRTYLRHPNDRPPKKYQHSAASDTTPKAGDQSNRNSENNNINEKNNINESSNSNESSHNSGSSNHDDSANNIQTHKVIHDVFYEQARSLQRGTWVDFYEPHKPATRCRLAAVIESTSTYIFVDRKGQKALEKSILGLALAFKAEMIVTVDDSQLFDRALEQVIVSLRHKEF
ncbi:DUF1631 family protein [Marinagarivorans algicola]|uniref:DUF1631 family protein n=1 Tax=Marinagarivorans algicola TaxID=1513270 RepID=UPI003736F63E